ncbi:MAG: hypothetical protein COC09_07240 [Gammaproteobacteria bacterium]|nr:MAG: hypothetical protein COC09_07240 [Gammaproteobacteria bacterium]
MPYRIIAPAIFFLLLVACSGLAQQERFAGDRYHQNFQKWQQAGWQDYDLIYQRQCFCLAEVLKKIRVEVRDGRIVSAGYADGNSRINPDRDYDLKSIDDWFELISEAIDRPADSLQVRYDERLGYPRSISIDYYQRMADDEVSVKIFDVIQK